MATRRDIPNAKPAPVRRRGASVQVQEPPKKDKWWKITLSEDQRWVICFILIFVSAFIALSIVSHYFNWRADQMSGSVANSGGSWGLMAARFFVGDWFGIFALCVPVAGFILAYMAVRGTRGMLWRVVKIIIMSMIIGSVTLGAVTGADGAFGTGLGGKMGIDVARWLTGFMGRTGVALLMGMCILLLALYINSSRTIGAVNSLARKTASIFRPRHTDEGEDDTVLPAEDEEDDYDKPTEEEPAEEEDIVEVEREESEPTEEIEPQGGEELDVITDPDVEPCEHSGEEAEVEIIVPQDEDDEPTEPAVEPTVEPAEPEVSQSPFIDEDGDFVEITDGEPAPSVGVATQAPAPAPKPNLIDDELEIVETEIGGMEGLPTAEEGLQVGTGGVVETAEDGSVQVVVDEHSDEEAGKIGTLYDPTKELSRFKHPSLEILERHGDDGLQYSVDEINANKRIILDTLEAFGVNIRKKISATVGPTVTLYELEPEAGVKVARIKNLEDDLALALKATSIRLIVPMPGRGTIGVEIPNKVRRTVSMYSLLRSKKFQESKCALPVVIGKTIQNETFMFDLADMPHMIVAGATGQGKSVGLNAIIASLIYKRHPAELKFVMVDPKKVELSLYARLENHYLAKMESSEEAILTDTQKVVYTLNSLCIEMEERYKLLRAAGVKRIDAYNQKFLERKLHPKYGHRYLPYIVVVIDEFADMIMTAGKEVETPIQRLGQLARAIGIHLIIATQRPDAKVITGLISSNCPARMGFKVANVINSRIILGEAGAEKLVGKGDMLMQINGEMTRLQCAFIDTPEIERIVDCISSQQGYTSAYLLPDYVPEDGDHAEPREDVGDLDSEFEEVARFVVSHNNGSTSTVQRKYKFGYTRAARIMDQLEVYGIVGKANGSKPREVLVTDMASLERILGDIFIENL